MNEFDYKIQCEEDTINKYIDNKNFEKVGMEYVDSNRYSSEEDISTLEFQDYSKCDWWNKDTDETDSDNGQNLEVSRNFISDVELSDLTEIMCRNSEMIDELEGYTDVESLEKCMKSIVRIVHRFSHSRGHYIPITETNKSRHPNTIW